jgi:hypothetical protein
VVNLPPGLKGQQESKTTRKKATTQIPSKPSHNAVNFAEKCVVYFPIWFQEKKFTVRAVHYKLFLYFDH